MNNSVVTTKGQVVIPSKLRRKHGIKSGTLIHFYEKEGEIRIAPLTHSVIDTHIGFLHTKGRLTKSLLEEKKVERKR